MHVAGAMNAAADALSHDDLTCFSYLVHNTHPFTSGRVANNQ